jgi:hypothetical protein
MESYRASTILGGLAELGRRTTRFLKVTAYLDRRNYPCGLKHTPEQVASLRLRRHDTLPEWNYTIKPEM